MGAGTTDSEDPQETSGVGDRHRPTCWTEGRSPAPLVPELDVSNLDRSLEFYCALCGFGIAHQRPEDAFAYLELDGAELMIQQADGPGRRFRTAELKAPFGRGINLQIEVADVDAQYERILAASCVPLVALERRVYAINDLEVANRQFVAADPDGYLLRFFSDVALP